MDRSSQFLAALDTRLSQTPAWAKLVTLAALPVSGYLTANFVHAYQGWLAMGPGGLPYGFTGYLANVLLTGVFAMNETKSLGVYDKPQKHASGWKDASDDEKANVQKSFLDQALSPREGPEAKSIVYNAPQRERYAHEYLATEIRDAYTNAFTKLVEKHRDAIEWKTSVLEKRGRAMFLKEDYSIPTLIAKGGGEVGHIHESDLSGHVFLSFADAKEVIVKGLGERHRMSGTVIPLGYTFLYVPRNLEEVNVLIGIFEAGIEYAKSSGKKA